MSASTEITAMASIEKALADLDPSTTSRVLRWATEKYNLQSVGLSPVGGKELKPELDKKGLDCVDAASLFYAAMPKTASDKALVMAYWFQVLQGNQEWASQAINAELKNLGHKVGNITDALNGLIRRKPSWAMQVQKSGPTKQARKRYKLTISGTKAVEAMLREAANNSPEE